jgi:hypothetical protein
MNAALFLDRVTRPSFMAQSIWIIRARITAPGSLSSYWFSLVSSRYFIIPLDYHTSERPLRPIFIGTLALTATIEEQTQRLLRCFLHQNDSNSNSSISRWFHGELSQGSTEKFNRLPAEEKPGNSENARLRGPNCTHVTCLTWRRLVSRLDLSHLTTLPI